MEMALKVADLQQVLPASGPGRQASESVVWQDDRGRLEARRLRPLRPCEEPEAECQAETALSPTRSSERDVRATDFELRLRNRQMAVGPFVSQVETLCARLAKTSREVEGRPETYHFPASRRPAQALRLVLGSLTPKICQGSDDYEAARGLLHMTRVWRIETRTWHRMAELICRQQQTAQKQAQDGTSMLSMATDDSVAHIDRHLRPLLRLNCSVRRRRRRKR